MKRGAILLAHGARSAAWAAPFERLAAGLARARPDRPVRLAFLELMQPDLVGAVDELVREGCQRIDVLPCFFGGAGHVLRDVPAQVEAARQQHPQLQLEVLGALGEQPLMQAALLGVCEALLADEGSRAVP
jgi:sirohydrochlorin cobaltochelatase